MSIDFLKSETKKVIYLNVEDCIFCQIIKKEIPARILYENDVVLAFLDIFPISEGHTIVIPKEHYTTLNEIPNEILGVIFSSVKEISDNLLKKLKFDGYNILQNNFEAAGQVVKHFHVHIIPRTKEDLRLVINSPEKKPSEKELDFLLARLTEN